MKNCTFISNFYHFHCLHYRIINEFCLHNFLWCNYTTRDATNKGYISMNCNTVLPIYTSWHSGIQCSIWYKTWEKKFFLWNYLTFRKVWNFFFVRMSLLIWLNCILKEVYNIDQHFAQYVDVGRVGICHSISSFT